MTDEASTTGWRYEPPAPTSQAPMYLAQAPDSAPQGCVPFYERVEIGRDDGRSAVEPGLLLLADPTVSRHHCVVVRRGDGRCFVRDVSRNGTRLDGRRLVPNVETEWLPGHTITVGDHHDFVLLGEECHPEHHTESISTIPVTNRSVVTVLVGDIRDYTVLVRTALSEAVQRAVSRVFEALSAAVVEHGGTVKEYQGDALLAFWERGAGDNHAVRACRAAIALDALARRMAADPAIWPISEFPLEMDWALSTGLVLIDSFGKGQPTGLSMMGEPVVRAFRIEKFATAETGRIVTCSATREMTGGAFAYRDLGKMLAKGFDRPDHVFALEGEL